MHQRPYNAQLNAYRRVRDHIFNVAEALAGLQAVGIAKCHIFVFGANDAALAYWRSTGWIDREELAMLSRPTDLRAPT